LNIASNTADNVLEQIERNLNNAVSAFPGWDLSEAIAAITTANGAGRAEVKFNYSRGMAMFTIRSFDDQVVEVLAGAETDNDVNQISELIDAAFEDVLTQLAVDLDETIGEAA
jgi:hypothetical protein